MVKNSPPNVGDLKDVDLIPGWENSLEEEPTPVFMPGEFHKQKSLVGYSP